MDLLGEMDRARRKNKTPGRFSAPGAALEHDNVTHIARRVSSSRLRRAPPSFVLLWTTTPSTAGTGVASTQRARIGRLQIDGFAVGRLVARDWKH
jgi:hypothetical protein